MGPALFGLLIALSTPSFAKGPSPEAALQKKYSFEELQSAALYTTALTLIGVEAQIDNKAPAQLLKCDPQTGVADRWSMRLKSLIDVKQDKERKAYLARNLQKRTKDKKYLNCEKTCLCGAYAEVISGIDASKLKEADLNLHQEMQLKHEAQTNTKMYQCARSSLWFCKGALIAYLRKNYKSP